MTRVASGHHILGIEHLLGEFWDGESAILLTATRSERSEAGHEEVETGEGNHVDRQLTQVSVQLTREPKARRHTCNGVEGNGVTEYLSSSTVGVGVVTVLETMKVVVVVDFGRWYGRKN